MNKYLKNENGAALVVTLSVVLILMVAAFQLQRMTSSALIRGRMMKNSFQAEQTAVSGIYLASILLAEDARKNSIDSIQEEWADAQWLSEAVGALGYPPGALTLKITDELSKLQVNAFLTGFPGNEVNMDQFSIWETFFRAAMELAGYENTDPAPIVNSLKDWLDSLDDDAVSGLSGAESDYYEDLEPAYSCANGPVNEVDELFLIKGITRDLFEAGALEAGEQMLEMQPAIDDMITVFGLDKEASGEARFRFSGKVNINTAPITVLAALLPVGMEAYAQELVDFREQKGDQGVEYINPLDKGWYKRVIDLSGKELDRFERLIRYNSEIFRVESIAVQDSTTVRMIAYLQREQDGESGSWVCRTIRMERKE